MNNLKKKRKRIEQPNAAKTYIKVLKVKKIITCENLGLTEYIRLSKPYARIAHQQNTNFNTYM